ncbi:YtxH domain-containing protein [Sporolactobacillus shoreicorticis]|uniref:YtxH domain-containing protein n=1 Tax=Sporolactobacillus shoreicorticis TaxID=1923877 RepID=A0ABW5S4T4_9BACL|nr:YtxH domain-containing protein [Sporolactobacillus shoreicorticis]MCO7126227.1 YtxH domain-containing protein [Sporolactobacillus shoreicorticis]
MSSENEKCSCSGTSVKELVLGGIIGGAIGASIALLFAPKSGVEMRRDLSVKEFVDSGVEKVKQVATSLLHKDDEPFS